MEKTMVLLMGLQGSGKSTFYQKYLADRFVRVNLDTLKTRYQEKLLIDRCLAEGTSFAVDNTNPTREDRARYISVARAAGYRVVGYFLESKLQECIARNDRRTGTARVPAKAIAATSNRLQLPSGSEGFDALYFVKNDGQVMTVGKWREPYEF